MIIKNYLSYNFHLEKYVKCIIINVGRLSKYLVACQHFIFKGENDMRRQMKKLVLGVALSVMTMYFVACGKDKDGDIKVDTDVKVETGDVDTDVKVDTGDINSDEDVNVENVKTDNKVHLDKYIGGTGKAINQAGYKYDSISGRDGKYVVKYKITDIEPDIRTELSKIQGSNIAKLLIKDDTIGLGYEPNGEKYKFKLTAGSVYMTFELVGSEQIFEQYRDVEHKKIREMGELHSIPIINLQIEYMYCYAVFDESGSAIIETDNFTPETAQEMLSSCTVVDFYYEYGLAD